MVVSTCNRAELYVACQDPKGAIGDLQTFFSEFHRLPLDQIRPHLYALQDNDAVRHLFRVASGLDSLVVGEPQILGQVKDAFAIASCPALRAPEGLKAPMTIDEILEALRALDEGPRNPPGGKPMRLRPVDRAAA